MSIRKAKPDDIATLMDYFRAFHPESVWGHLALDETKFANNMRQVIQDTSGASCFFVADGEDGVAHGVLVGQIDTYYFSRDPVAKLVFYWVHPDHRYSPDSIKLMMAFRQWAENRQAREMMIGVTSGENIELADRMLKKMGARPIGGNYSIVLGAGITSNHEQGKKPVL
ncbi:N-acetyltransferase family protein [Candidatus Ferrigenium straubiae]|jgi:hypothetical protein|uniref:GNAT family N-acetyltransferase n=1 Tax=Candidatus Ferrigenium straubiae TaxID=2919506 RepID=UPI003F4AC526